MKADTLVVLGTGGTIAGRQGPADGSRGYRAGVIAVADLLGGVPVPSGMQVECHQLAQIDSKDMDLVLWKALLSALQIHMARPEVAGIVVTHGTDTLEETAYLLQRALAPSKPVVMTCAMRPATALSADGPHNLGDALAVASVAGAQGVVVVCAGRIHSAMYVQKVHTSWLDAFDSGDAGPLGVIEQGITTLWQAWPESVRQATPVATIESLLERDAWPRVECLISHAGADGALVRALLQSQGDAPLRGLVVGGTGNGTVHRSLEATLRKAEQQGVAVRLTTRCANGRITGNVASEGGEFPVIPLPLPKARVALMLELL